MWKTVKLGDLCEVVTKGTTPTSVGFKFESQGINFVKVESLAADSTFIASKFAKINSECHESLKRSQLKDGDILFSIAGALGRTAIVTEDILPANTNQALAILRLKENVEVDKRFLLYVLNSESTREQSDSNKGGVAQQNLSLTQLKNYEVTLPPLAEQQRIVAKLDAAFAEIDRAIEVTEEGINQQKLLLQKVIDEKTNYKCNGSAVYEIGSFCSIKHGFAFKSADFSKSDDEKLPIVLTPGNFKEDGTLCFSDKNTKRCTSECVEGLLFPIGSLVVVMTDLSSHMKLLGKPAFIEQPNVLHNQRIGLVKNDEQLVSNRYLYHFFRSTTYLNEIRKTATGTMVRHTAPKRILATKIFAPSSLSEQLKLCEQIDQVQEKISENVEKKATQLEQFTALKSAILAQELQPPQSEAA